MPATTPVKLLVISGSARQGSYNGMLARLGARLAEEAGARVTPVDLRALQLPVYDGDLEAAQGVPDGARTLLRLVHEHDGILLASPEYNSLPTPLLLNSFDWMSRLPAEDGLPGGTAVTAGKAAGIVAASPGGFGGVRALPIVRQYLQNNFGMLVVPEHFALAQAHTAFDAHGELPSENHRKALARVVNGLLRVAAALKAG